MGAHRRDQSGVLRKSPRLRPRRDADIRRALGEHRARAGRPRRHGSGYRLLPARNHDQHTAARRHCRRRCVPRVSDGADRQRRCAKHVFRRARPSRRPVGTGGAVARCGWHLPECGPQRRLLAGAHLFCVARSDRRHSLASARAPAGAGTRRVAACRGYVDGLAPIPQRAAAAARAHRAPRGRRRVHVHERVLVLPASRRARSPVPRHASYRGRDLHRRVHTIALAGFGPREIGAAAVFAIIGGSVAPATAASVLYGLAATMQGLCAALLFAWQPANGERSKAASRS